MAENVKRLHSVHEAVDKILEKSVKRLSLFETSNHSSEENENIESYLQEWDQRWGKHNVDYVNVYYSQDYVQQIKEEIDSWITGLKEMMGRSREFASDVQYSEILEGCESPQDHKVPLLDINYKINNFIKMSNTFLECLETSRIVQESRLREIDREIKIVEKLVLSEKNK